MNNEDTLRPEYPADLIKSGVRVKSARQDFSRKLKWDPSDFSGEKLSWRLLPSAARVRPTSAAAHNSPSVRCTPLAYANDLTPCRMALHFDYASAAAPTSSKRPAPTATRGSSYTAPLALRFLYSFHANSYREGTNIVLVDLDLHRIFPDSESVNRALRKFAKEHQIS